MVFMAGAGCWHGYCPPTEAEVGLARQARGSRPPAYPLLVSSEQHLRHHSIPGELCGRRMDVTLRDWGAWLAAPDAREAVAMNIMWMKRCPGIDSQCVRDLEAHPWARRINMHAALVACNMGAMRVLLRRTKGRGGWGTIYLLQRLGAHGMPEPHYKVGMTMQSGEARRRGVASNTMRDWVLLGEWRSQFAPKVEHMIHAQLRCHRAYGDRRREWYDVSDVCVIVTAIEDMLAAAAHLYVLARGQQPWGRDERLEAALAGCYLHVPDPAPLVSSGQQ